MKVWMFRVKGPKKRVQNQKISIEKILFVSFIFMFLLLVMIQTALLTPGIQAYIPSTAPLEGSELRAEEYLFQSGQIDLELEQGISNEKLMVLVNGDPVCTFLNSSIQLNVKDGDVIELDGTATDQNCTVKVASISENISSEILNLKQTVGKSVERLTKVTMN